MLLVAPRRLVRDFSPSMKSISVTRCTMKRRIVSSSCSFSLVQRALVSLRRFVILRLAAED